MFSGNILDAYAQAVAQEEFARRVAEEREGHVRGGGSPYSVGGYQSEIPNPGTGDVPVQFSEPGLETPMLDPVDFIAGGVAGKVGSAMAKKAAVRQFTDLFDPKWGRTTRVTPEYGGSTAGAIIDGNPFLRTEPSKRLMQTTRGKGSWVNDAFPYVERGRMDGDRAMGSDLAHKLYDSASAGDMSWETADGLLDMMAKMVGR